MVSAKSGAAHRVASTAMRESCRDMVLFFLLRGFAQGWSGPSWAKIYNYVNPLFRQPRPLILQFPRKLNRSSAGEEYSYTAQITSFVYSAKRSVFALCSIKRIGVGNLQPFAIMRRECSHVLIMIHKELGVLLSGGANTPPFAVAIANLRARSVEI